MATVALPEYQLISALPAALGPLVDAQVALGWAALGVPYPGAAGVLEQVMFRGQVASFVSEYAITTATVGAPLLGEFEVADDQSNNFHAGYKFTITRSTGNDGVYTVLDGGSTYAAGFTTIPVNEEVFDGTADGFIEGWSGSVGP